MKQTFFSSAFFSILFCFTISNALFAKGNPPGLLAADNPGIPFGTGDPDSVATKLGHCNPIIVPEVNCTTGKIELGAYILWTFTGLFEPILATWSTGELAHKITVIPPGAWSWDASGTGCEENHWENEYIQPGAFFFGSLDIQGPASLCSGQSGELSVEAGGYNFPDFAWDPANPGGDISPYQISAPGTYTLSVADELGCPFSEQITVAVGTEFLASESISFCTGESVTIGGQTYTQSGTVTDTIPAIGNACDTIITYSLTLVPFQTRAVSISLCPGESVSIGGQVYTQSGTVTDTLTSVTGCDTIVTYTLSLVPFQTQAVSISLCPGESVTIGGQVYTQSGTVADTLTSVTGCDTIVTYTLTLLAQPTLANTIVFCPGQTISLGGASYTQPGTVVLTLPSTSGGCDTIATYTLQLLTPAPSNVSLTCPSPVSVIVPIGSSGTVVNFNPATATSNCPCPGIALSQTSGLVSGSNFPKGITPICFAAKDSCGQTASCCFNVSIAEDVELACDTKVVGCMKYELLTITADAGGNRSYRIRVTNNCSNKLIYSTFQVPLGVLAIEPANNSVYTAPSGNTYRVRNPNFQPQYSIRYSSILDSINLGESDIFKYTLPAQASVTFIEVRSKLAPNVVYDAILSTFQCPIGVTQFNAPPSGVLDNEKAVSENLELSELRLFPNPASQSVEVFVGSQTGELHLLDQTGRVVLRQSVAVQGVEFSVAELPQGLYQVIFIGEKTMLHSALAVQR